MTRRIAEFLTFGEAGALVAMTALEMRSLSTWLCAAGLEVQRMPSGHISRVGRGFADDPHRWASAARRLREANAAAVVADRGGPQWLPRTALTQSCDPDDVTTTTLGRDLLARVGHLAGKLTLRVPTVSDRRAQVVARCDEIAASEASGTERRTAEHIRFMLDAMNGRTFADVDEPVPSEGIYIRQRQPEPVFSGMGCALA